MLRIKALILALAFATAAYPNSRDFTDTASDYLSKASTCSTITAPPATLGIWAKFDDATSSDDLISLGDGTNASLNVMALRTNSATGFVVAKGGDPTSSTDAVTTGAHTTGTWENGLASYISASSRAVYLNGTNKGTASTSRIPSGIDTTIIGSTQNQSGNHFDGNLAHAAIWNRALSDLEAAYWGAGGNPRAISGLTCYYKIAGASPEVDSLGGDPLTVHGTTSEADNPTIATAFTGTSYSTQTWTQSSAISSLSVDARFDDVSSAFTTSWKLLGSSTDTTDTSGTGTNSRELTVASAAAIVAGDYIKITSTGAPTLVLHKSSNTLLLAGSLSWSSGQDVFEIAVGNATITGVTLSAGSLSGTPSNAQAQTDNYFFRATNNTTGSLIADSNLFSITVNAAASGTFSVNPSVTAQTAVAYTIGGTTTGSTTVSAVACKKDSTAPSIANVVAGNCASGAAEAAQTDTWNGADSLTLGSALALPIYDIYVTDGTTLITRPDEMLDAPAGKQYITLTSVSGTSWCDDFNDTASPGIAASDVLKIDTLTDPDDFAVTVDTACDLSYSGTSARQLIQYDVYDTSAGAYMSGGPGNLWFNNLAPIPPDPDTIIFFVPLNSAMTPVDLSPYCPDPEGDVVTVTNVDVLPAGLSIASSTLQGTATVRGKTLGITLRCMDAPGASVDWE